MGYYQPTGFLEFDGTDSENQMVEKLFLIMDVLNYGWEELEKAKELEDVVDKYKLPIRIDCAFPIPLLGRIERFNREEDSFYLPYLELDLAPKLFAALFPNASFHYEFTPWYSVSNDDTETMTAIYKDKKLMVRMSYYDHEKAELLCKKLIDQDEYAREKCEKYLVEHQGSLDEPDSVDWFDLLGEITGSDGKETVDASYEFEEILPSRDSKYEKSFFDIGVDLQIYLAGDQIKHKNISIMDYIKAFSYTEEQFLYFLKIAEEYQFTEMSKFLLEEKQRRFL